MPCGVVEMDNFGALTQADDVWLEGEFVVVDRHAVATWLCLQLVGGYRLSRNVSSLRQTVLIVRSRSLSIGSVLGRQLRPLCGVPHKRPLYLQVLSLGMVSHGPFLEGSVGAPTDLMVPYQMR